MADADDGKKKKKEKKKEAPKSNLEVYDEVKMRFEVNKQTERADHYETAYKELKKKSDIIKSQYYSQRETQADIMKDLNKLVEEQGNEVDRQKSIVEALHRSMDDAENRHREELDENDQKWQLKLQESQDKMNDLQTALDKVTQYITKKNQLQAKLSDLEKQLSDAHEQHGNEISLLDRKKAVEIDQLKKDMLSKIRETRDSLRLKTKDQLDVITKRTIMENEQMSTELAFQSKETEKLIEKNKRLYEDNTVLRRNVQLHRELEEELAKRTHVYQRLIKRLNTKLEQTEKKLKQETEEKNALASKIQSLEQMNEHLIFQINSGSTFQRDQGSLGQTNLHFNVTNTGVNDPDSNSMGGGHTQYGTTPGGTGGRFQAITPSTFSGPSGAGNTLDHTFSATTSDVGGGGAGGMKGATILSGIGNNTVTGGTGYSPSHNTFINNNVMNINHGTYINNATGSTGSSDWALRKENEELRRNLSQSRSDFHRFKRDHRALMQLQDHTTRLIVLELYELKQQMEHSYKENGSLENYFQRLESENVGNHVFTMMNPKQRQMFFKVLLEKLSTVHSNSMKLPSVITGGFLTNQVAAGKDGLSKKDSSKNKADGKTNVFGQAQQQSSMQSSMPSPLQNMAQSPKSGTDQETTSILTKILTQIATENKGVQTMPISELVAAGQEGHVPDWYGVAAQQARKNTNDRPGKHYRVNVIRGDVREWGGKANTIPLKKQYLTKKH